jgi:hypothetical protein
MRSRAAALLSSLALMLGVPLAYHIPLASALNNCTTGTYDVTATPNTGSNSDDTAALTVGTKFQIARPATVTNVAFYRTVANTGGYSVGLWDDSGTLLGSGTVGSGGSVPAWTTVSLSTPVSIDANTTYVAGYFVSGGRYHYLSHAYDSAKSDKLVSTPLGAGVYSYDSSMAFPTSTYNNTSYYVSPGIAYEDTTAPSAPSGVSANTLLDSTRLTWAASTDTAGSYSNQASFYSVSVDGGSGAGGTNSNPLFDLFSLTQGSHSYSITAWDHCGNESSATTGSFNVTDTSIWGLSVAGGGVNSTDDDTVTLGTKFSSSSDGVVKGVKFFHPATVSSPVTVGLWDDSGTLLASKTASESLPQCQNGWCYLYFTTPVSIDSDTDYRVGYISQDGHYFYASGGLDSGVSQNGFTVPTGGGYYTYGSSLTFPTSVYNNTNYFVDVIFKAN